MNKKLISGTLTILMILLLASSVLAISPIGSIFDTEKEDAPDIELTFPQYHGEDRLSSTPDATARQANPLLSREYKIDGYFCSETADAGWDIPLPAGAGSLCFTNEYHNAIAWQLFNIDGATWIEGYKGQVDLSRGERGCFYNLEPGMYHQDFYYCDELIDTTCTDTDGGRSYTTYGEVTVTGGGNHQTWEDDCWGDELQERYCDQYDTVATTSKDCTDYGSQYTCKDGKCQVEQTCQTHQYYQCYGGNVYYYNSCGQREEMKDYCTPGYESCENSGSTRAFCETSCSDTCSTEGKVCGYWTICGEQTYCGSCSTGQTCSNGQCVSEGDDYDLRVISKSVKSPQPGVIEGTFTLKNYGTKSIGGLFSMEVCTDQENTDYNCDGRHTTPRAGFDRNEVCENSEDQQAWFTLLAGESDTITLTSVIGRGDTYPIVLGVSSKCYIDGGVPLQSLHPGNYEGFGLIADVAVANPPQTVTCSGGALVGDYKCSSDLSSHQVCLASGQWKSFTCPQGQLCSVSAGSVCKPTTVCDGDGKCEAGEAPENCPSDCAGPVTGAVEFNVLSRKKVDNYYEAKVTVRNGASKPILGLATLELITKGEQQGTLGYAGYTNAELITCQRPEDAQVRVQLNPGQSDTYTLKAYPLSGEEYVDVAIGIGPDCYKDMPASLSADAWFKVFDYNAWQSSGTDAYNPSELISVVDKTDAILKTCSECPFTVQVDYTDFTNKCWTGIEPGESTCKPGNIRYECQCFPEVQECRMIVNGCGNKDCVEVMDSSKDLAMCEGGEEEEEFVCVRSQKTVHETLAEYEIALSDAQTAGTIADYTTSSLSAFWKLIGSAFGFDIGLDDELEDTSNDLKEILAKMETQKDIVSEAKEIGGYYWDWISKEQYNAQKDLWFLQDTGRDECREFKDETTQKLEAAIAKYNETKYGDPSTGYVPNADPNDLSKMTTNDKLSHSCIDSKECEDDGKCRSLTYIIDQGWLSELDAQNYMDEVQSGIGSLDFDVATDLSLSGIASGICLAVAGVGGTATGGILWSALPICAGIGGVTWAGLNWVSSATEGDTSAFGMCIDESKEGFFNMIKNAIADAFNVDPSSATVTYVLVGLAIFLAFIVYLLVAPPRRRG